MQTDKPVQSDKSKKTAKAVIELDPRQKRKENLEILLKSRFFYIAAYEIYGGVKGLYDYGPPGCAIQSNILSLWREWFILEDNMQQIQTAALTPEVVFQTSGHVAKFQDHMVRDLLTGECYRADHLLEAKIDELLKKPQTPEFEAKLKEHHALAGGMKCEELSRMMIEYKIVSPDTGNAISECFPFNLMFSTQIGPTGKFQGFLRPETAQGMFVNFHRLLEYNGGKLPFSTAQIGPAFRNEIAPRSGLLRVREFTLAEIEHFLDPLNKDHEKFHLVRDVEVPLLTSNNQTTTGQITMMTIGDAVAQGVINNQTLAYFLARTYLFLLHVGVQPDKIRFREHMLDEMAHYACGCFDAEIHSSYGWVECVGLADRSAYDLSVHQKASGQNLSAWIQFPQTIEADVTVVVPNKQLLGKQFKKEAQAIILHLESLRDEKAINLKNALAVDGTVEILGQKISADMLKIESKKEKITGRGFIPNVIEPAFGIGRIMYSILDGAYYVRPQDEQRGVLRLKPRVAPFLTTVLPLVTSDDKIMAKVYEIENILKKKKITSKLDITSVAIGRRYARTDELGIPFGITVDKFTFEGNTVDTITLRERDSCEQVRVPIAEICVLLFELYNEEITWEQVTQKYPVVVQKETNDDNAS